MSTKHYPLEAILSTVSHYKKSNNSSEGATKRLIFNQAPIGGISSGMLIFFFIALPFIEYASIFNPYVFNYFGIAQSIVVFIVFLVVIMQLVFVMIWKNNKTALKKIRPSWEAYFPDVDLNVVLSSGVSPYSDFLKNYSQAMAEDLRGEALYAALKDAFVRMSEENKDLLEMIRRDKRS